MLHMILILLKGLGICLGVFAGLLVLILSGILFLPICYRMEGNWNRMKEERGGRAVIRWCFGLVSACFYYEEGAKWKVRVAFWKWGSDSLLGQEKKERQSGGKTSEEKSDDEADQKETDPVPFQEMEPEDPVDQTDPEMEENPGKVETAEKESTEKSILNRIRQGWEEIKRKFRNIHDTIRWLQEQKEALKEFLGDPIHQRAFQILKKEGRILLKKLKPKDIRGRFVFGFEDPGTTGYVLAGLAVLYPVYEDRIEILPDFETEVLEVDGSVCGRVYLWWMIRLLTGLGCRKAVRMTYRDIMEYKNNMARRKGRDR